MISYQLMFWSWVTTSIFKVSQILVYSGALAVLECVILLPVSNKSTFRLSDSLVFSLFTIWSYHCQDLIPEHFCHQKENPELLSLGTGIFISCKWTSTVRPLLLAFFTNILLKTHSWCCKHPSFIPFYNWIVFHDVSLPHLTYTLLSWSGCSIPCLLWITVLCVCVLIYFIILPSIYPVKLSGIVTLCLTCVLLFFSSSVSCSPRWPWTWYIAKAGFEHLVLLPLPPECADYKH